MPTLDQAIITYAGKSLLDKVNAGMSKIEYTRVVYSIDDFSKKTDEEIKNTVQINNQNIITKPLTLLGPDGETQVRVDGNNENLSEGIYIKTYAVFAKGDDGNEIIFAIEASSHSDYLIGNDDKKKPQSVFYVFKTKISETNNVVFLSYKDIYATLDDLSNTKKELQTDIDTKASIEQSQYNVIRELTNADDLFHIDKNGRYIGNGIIPKNSPYNAKSWFIFEKNNFYAMFTDNGGDRFIVADYSKGWIKIPNENDMKQQYTQVKNLFTTKIVGNAKDAAQNDPEPHIYKDYNNNSIYQGNGVGAWFQGLPEVQQDRLDNVNINYVLKNGFYFIGGSNSISNMPSGASNYGMLRVINFDSDIFQTYEDTRGSMYKRQYNYGDWREWKQIYYGSYY